MRKLIAFLMFLLAVGQGATAQEVSGQQMPLPNEELHQLTPSTELHQLAPNAELHPITPTYSDILMMKALSSFEFPAALRRFFDSCGCCSQSAANRLKTQTGQ
jgi:hypothetical protein